MMNTMKKTLTSAAILIAAALTATAQVRTSYFVESSTYRNQYNPAFAPHYGYFRLPFLGGFNFNLDGTLSINDFIIQNPNPDGPGLTTILSSSVSEEEALKGLDKKMNSFNFNTNINLLGFGGYTKNRKNFWSVDMNLHAESALDIPFDFFKFLKSVTDGENVSDFSNMQLLAQSYADIGFNYSFPITDKLYVGARAKFLVGVAHANARMNRFSLTTNDQEWTAEMQAEMDIYLAGLSARENQTLDEVFDNFEPSRIKGASGYGFALDLGASYNILENLQVSVAVNDLGFIRWGNSACFATNNQKLPSFSGVDITVDGNGVTVVEPDFTLDELGLSVIGSGQAKATQIRATVNAGVEYELWHHRLGIGMLYHGRMGLYAPSHNVTASLSFHPWYWFTLAPSYTFNNNRGGAVGLALNLAPKGFNFFFATDVLTSKLAKDLYIPYKQDRMTFTFGVALNLGRHGYRIGEYATKWQKKDRK